jgi:hypothetical protein
MTLLRVQRCIGAGAEIASSFRRRPESIFNRMQT